MNSIDMTKVHRNRKELQEFVNGLALTNDSGKIKFPAKIHFITDHINKVVFNDVSINFDFPFRGELLINGNYNLKLYPTYHRVKYQDFKFVNNKYLLITAFHIVRSKTIGSFELKIMPN